jgi:hypothetical protein
MALQQSVTVTSTADGNFQDYEVTSKPDWVTVSKQGGQLNIEATPNTGAARSGVIVLTQNRSGKVFSIPVNQGANVLPVIIVGAGGLIIKSQI